MSAAHAASGAAPGTAAEASVDAGLVPGSRHLFVTLGGHWGGFGMPPFEFARILAGLGVSRVAVRDTRQLWYQGGIPEVPGGLAGLAGHLRERIANAGADRTTLIGNSMGAYAALVLGPLVGADRVLAFSPLTFLSLRQRIVHRDRRWGRTISAGRKHPDADPALWDVARMWDRAGGALPDTRIYYGTSTRLDRLHAERLRRFGNVRLFGSDGQGHDVIRHLRATGDLDEVLADAAR